MNTEFESVSEILSGEIGEPGPGPGDVGCNCQLGEQVASLKNEIAILQRLHGEAIAGWSKYQRLYDRDQDALRKIRDLVGVALRLPLTHSEKGGLLKVIENWADDQLPPSILDDLGDIPF